VRVEPVVVEPGTRRPERADRQLDEREERERKARREGGAEPSAQPAADAEPGHERGHDHRHGVEADAAVEREQALPDHLVDERGGAAQQEQQAGERDSGGVAPHRSAKVSCIGEPQG
jgi:hypothetical protein